MKTFLMLGLLIGVSACAEPTAVPAGDAAWRMAPTGNWHVVLNGQWPQCCLLPEDAANEAEAIAVCRQWTGMLP